MSDSEAKSHPASEKKLRDARRKGNLAQFQDLGVVLSMFAGLVTLWLISGRLGGAFVEALQLAFGEIAGDPERAMARIVHGQAVDAGGAVLVLAVVLALTRIVSSLVLNRGFIFTFEPVSPKPERLNPVSGLKRIFGRRGLVEAAKAVLRFTAGAALAIVLLRYASNAIIQTHACGLACGPDLLGVIVAAMFSAYLLLGLAFALPDIQLQSWLFRQEMRMSHSEMKREIKDLMGSPEVRAARQRLSQEIREGQGTRMSIDDATFAVFGGGFAVLLCYVRGQTPVPFVVAGASGGEATETLIAAATERALPYAEDPSLAQMIVTLGRPGGPIPPASYSGVANAIVSAMR